MNRSFFMHSVIFLSIISVAVLSRLLPHPPNVTPIAALALYAPVFRKGWISLLIPFAALLISDYFIGFSFITLYVYGAFLLVYLGGFLLRKNFSYLKLTGMVLSSSLLFFIVTNFGVWLHFPMYEKSIYGLLQCYYMAIPFFRNELIGTLAYSMLLFGFTLKVIVPLQPDYATAR